MSDPLSFFQQKVRAHSPEEKFPSPEKFFLDRESQEKQATDSLQTFFENHSTATNYFDFSNPKLEKNSTNQLNILEQYGAFVYFPLLNAVVGYSPDLEHYQNRTVAYSHLITSELQEKIKNTKILVIGMSVGASIITALLAKGARHITAYDDDIVSLDNLNRLPLGFIPGLKKADVLSQYAHLLDPYGRYNFHNERVTSENIDRVLQAVNPDIIIDECDDVGTKELLHEHAKKNRTPVLSAADVGQGCSVVDAWDYSKQDTQIPQPLQKQNTHALSSVQKIISLVGLDNIPREMLESLDLMYQGKLKRFPQEVSAVSLSSAAILNIVELVLSEQEVKKKTVISLPEILLSEIPASQKEETLELRKKIRKIFSLA